MKVKALLKVRALLLRELGDVENQDADYIEALSYFEEQVREELKYADPDWLAKLMRGAK